MLKKLLPLLLSALALVAGAVGGDVLRSTTGAGIAAPDPQAALPTDGLPALGSIAADNAMPAPPAAALPPPAEPAQTDAAAATAWFKFPQQFFVPVLHGGHLDSTMILSLSVEMPAAATEEVHAHEIKLRDALLRQLLIHANTGGFDGNFTTEAHLRKLRSDLTATARTIVPRIGAILIGDIARQER